MYKLHLDGGIFMENIYSDIAKRTDGDIYLGVVGPNRKIHLYKKVYGIFCAPQDR